MRNFYFVFFVFVCFFYFLFSFLVFSIFKLRSNSKFNMQKCLLNFRAEFGYLNSIWHSRIDPLVFGKNREKKRKSKNEKKKKKKKRKSKNENERSKIEKQTKFFLLHFILDIRARKTTGKCECPGNGLQFLYD